MKTVYFDMISGISGDMALGALLHAGVPLETLQAGIGKLGIAGVEIQAAHIRRSGITAVKADVVASAPSHHHRHLRDIRAMIEGSGLNERVKSTAVSIFETLGRAEAAVHGVDIGSVHFHEVGAVDSIVDIVGTAICLDALGAEAVYSSPVRLGSGGFVTTEHGRLPVPVPAVVELVKGYPAVLTDLPYELTTPTGAAIIRACSRGVLAQERMSVISTGYGAGTREMPEVPNLLRVLVADVAAGEVGSGMVCVETNIDNLNPEIYPYVVAKLLEGGAADAYLVPMVMKKGRPGVMVGVLAEQGRVEAVLEILFRETGTLGVRMYGVERRILEREERMVETEYGRVRVKVVHGEGGERYHVEYEECRRIAEERKIPLKEVYRTLDRGNFRIESAKKAQK